MMLAASVERRGPHIPGLTDQGGFRRSSRLSGLLLVLALAGLLQACGDERGRAAPYDTIRYGTGQPLQTFDPHRADTGPAFSTYLTLVYDGLTRPDPDNVGRAIPALAHHWTWVDDLTIEFDLQRGVTFIDGEQFDARAAKANLERMLEVEGPRVKTVASIRAVEVIDDYRLRIRLHYPDPTLTYNLGLSPGMMVSPAAFDNPHLDIDPVGTGPWIYDFERSTIGDVHRFSLNPGYYEGQPPGRGNYEIRVLKDARARLNALLSRQIDFAVLGPSEAEYAIRIGFEVETRMSRWMGMTIIDREGELVPEFADVRVRRALGYAVDRQALADVVFFGFAEPRSQPMATLGRVEELDDYFSYDPDKARALLEEADAVGLHFTVPVLPTVSAEYEAIQHYLGKVGINMEIKVIEPGTIGAVSRSREFPVNTIGYPNYDPDSRHLAIWGPEAAYNPFGLDTSRLEDLARRARQTLDEDLRERLFDEYFRIVVTEVYSLVYLHLKDVVAYDGARVTDVAVSRYIDPMLRDVRLRGDEEGQE